YTKRIYEITADIFLYQPLHEIRNLMNWNTFTKLLKIHQIDPFRTMHQGITRFFHDPKIVQLFDRYATYNGSNPFQAPATLNIIPYVEYGLGCYYIKGGMYRLIEVLEDIAESVGIDIHKSARVEEITHRSKEITGVRVNGENVKCDYVLSNADVVTVYNELITGFDSRRKSLNRLEPSLSGMVFLWSINKKFEQLAQHNIIFSENYKEEFGQIFKQHTVPDDPTIYIAITGKIDPEHAPANGENWFVLVNVPHLTPGQDWQQNAANLQKRVITKLSRHGIDVAQHIVEETWLTPEDFYKKYGSNRGSIYGISSNNKSTAFRRPANRSRDLQGLYFAGGSTHPGGGVPLAMLSGKMCADLIEEDI
ncbi:phytoene desaturase, partial [candidate division KSB1 bacterium]|nr:phytoene desaturase [candidate division KSB1 bacterium]